MSLSILIEPSDYILRNAGDTAMLRVAISRLSTLWPQADIRVFSDVPDQFPTWAPNAVPISAEGRYAWLRTPFLSRHLPPNAPAAARNVLFRAQHYLRRDRPELARFLLKASMRRRGEDPTDVEAFFGAVTESDVVIANGMGGITDAFPEYAHELLEVMRLAQKRGVATVFLGQGLGPLDDPDLRTLARDVLSKADFIALRERRFGVPLLRELGVSDERVMTTGDDAVELANSARPAELGSALGINMRASSYSGVNHQTLERVRPILTRLQSELDAALVPISISSVPGEEDSVTTGQLIRRNDIDIRTDFTELLARVGSCRVVIVGSYHAGVFALSMGIPAIGLYSSEYYRAKFVGLADMFGVGCWPVSVDASGFEQALVEAVHTAWVQAEAIRPQLLDAASEQVALARAAYERVQLLVDARRTLRD